MNPNPLALLFLISNLTEQVQALTQENVQLANEKLQLLEALRGDQTSQSSD